MIIVLKMSTGADYICTIECTEDDFIASSIIEVVDPMSIDRDSDGMKLRDVLMISDNERLTIRSNDVIFYYYPSKELSDYYAKALVYSKNYTKPNAARQIELAIQDIEVAMREEDATAKRLSQLLMRQSGSTLQ